MNKTTNVDASSQTDSMNGFDPCHAPDAPSVHVPREVDSISEAVRSLGEHGRVIVAPGAYRENLEIQPGAHIILQAEDHEPPSMFAAEPELPVIQVAPEAKFCLIGMSIRGAKSGLVAGRVATEQAAHAVTLINTHVADAEYGVYGLAEQFHIEESSIENNIYGLVLAGTASLGNTTIAANKFGLLLSGRTKPTCSEAAYTDTGKHVFIQKVNVSNNEDGGIAICNVSSATVNDTYVHKNAYMGVQIRNTPKFSLNNIRVGETRLWNGKWGDGLHVVHSSGDVKNSQFSANKRANIVYYGNCGGSIDNNLILYAIFAIYLEGLDGVAPTPAITNNYMYGNKENKVSLGLHLAPSKPPEVPPP